MVSFVDQYVKPGNVVWDVGANVGLLSVAASVRAGASGKVFAFEPDNWLVEPLRKTARVQSEEGAAIEVLPLGLAGEIGIRRFGLARRSRATNHLDGYGSTQTGGIAEWISLLCVTLDWACQQLPAPQILKIDVEGAEGEVFQS